MMKKETNNVAKEPVTVKQNGKNIEVKLKRVRLSFCDVFEPLQGKDDKGNPTDRFYYSTNILLDKNTEEGKAQIAAVRQAMKDARLAEWGDNPPTMKADCLCLKDGEPVDPDTVNDDGTGGVRKALYDGYEGQMYISANKPVKSKDAPNPIQILGPRKTAVDSNGKPCFPTLKETDGLIYAGCWADVIVQIYPYNAAGKSHPSRINASLEAIKFVEHGQPFGAKKVDAQSAFDEEPTDEDDDDDTGSPSAQSEDDPFA